MNKKRVRLFHWNKKEAEEKIEKLGAAGYEVAYDLPEDTQSYRALRDDPLDAFVIDLSRLPSHGREVASFLRQQKPLRQVPIVFAEGAPEKVENIKTLLPDAVFTTWRRMGAVLKKAIANPPIDPVVPRPMAGYSGTPLPKKLGIKRNFTVILAGAPADFEDTLGELPQGVRFKRQARGENDLVLWFTSSKKDLERRMSRMGKLAGSGGLWIMWPKKASGVKTDVTQTLVRNAGLDSGLVDFKIAAIDATWSGLKFAKRRTT